MLVTKRRGICVICGDIFFNRRKYDVCSPKCNIKYLLDNNINGYKDKQILYRIKYEESNKDKISLRKKFKYNYHPINRLSTEEKKEKKNTLQRIYLKNNPDKRKKYNNKWAINNYGGFSNYRKTNINIYIRYLLRNRLRQAIKTYLKKGIIIKAKDKSINYSKSVKYLIKTIPKDFELGIYHIDHIIPLKYFDLTNKNKIEEAFSPQNLQWLKSKDNFKKNDKIIPLINF